MTILIVDDNVGMRRMIRSVLSGKRHVFHECSDGTTALARFDQVRPDVVLMDVVMPRMDGITATRLMKRDHPEAKVIMVTDHADRRTRAAAREAGADGFVRKEDLLKVPRLLQTIAD